MQQINLYQDEFRTPKDPISAALIGQIIVGSLAVVIAVTAVIVLIGWRAAVAAQGVKGEVAALTDQSRSLAAELRARDQGAFFAESVQQAERQLASSETIRAFLGQLQRQENEGFSIIFERPCSNYCERTSAHCVRILSRRRSSRIDRRSLEFRSGAEIC